jgi:putative colanic acid biosynthesis glycosyltransferase
MLFSIVTVTRNNIEGLRRTQAGIAAQTFPEYEWLVADGGSTDGTVDFLKTTQAHWLTEKDRGIYDAMNKGLTHASGDYVLFLNAGDEFAAPDTLQKIAARLARAGELPDFIYGDALEAGHYKTARAHTKMKRGMFTHHQAMLYRRGAAADLRYDLSYAIAADYDFTARFLKTAHSVLYCPFPVCRFEPGGISQQRTMLGRREQFQVRERLKIAGSFGNAWIYGLQSAALLLRRLLPGIYWRLKKRL